MVRSPRGRRPQVGGPAGPTETGAEEAFGKFLPGKKISYIAFAGELDGQVIYEVWYFDSGEYWICFITHDPVHGYQYVESINVLIHKTEANLRALGLRLQTLREGRLRLYVASAAFFASLAALLWMAIRNSGGDQSSSIIAAIIGVVASGGLFFFGAWVPAGLFRGSITRAGGK